jgi:ABC-type transporter Mla subunit MlaD
MERSRDFLTGLVFFGLLAALGVVTIFLADFSLKPAHLRTISFRDVGGLEEGGDVRVNGVRSGKIRSITARPEQDDILVTVRFYDDPKLNRNATFRIATASALGGQFLAVDRGETTAGPLPEEAELRGETGLDMLGAATKALARAEDILAENQDRIRSLVENLEEFAKALNQSGTRSLARLEETLGSASRVAARLDETDVAGRIGTVLQRIESIAAKIDEGDGLLPALLTDSGMKDDLAQTLSSLKTVAGNLEQGKGTIGALLSDATLHDRFLDVVANLEAITSTESGLGRLLTSDEPWRRVERTLESVESAARRVETASAGIVDRDTPLGFFLNDRETVQKLRRAVDSLNRFFETQNENAPLTTFASLLLRPF